MRSSANTNLVFLSLLLTIFSACGLEDKTSQLSRERGLESPHEFRNELETSSSWSGAMVGSVPYSLSVDKNGQSSIGVPIKTLPVGSGLTPSVSLQYYSGNNSVTKLGYSWSLGDISSITRCPKTLPYDGENSRISFDDDSPFCLNGQRLVNVGSENGTKVFRSASETFIKVLFDGNKFEVYEKNGLIKVFDGSSSSTVLGESGNIYSWGLTELKDRNNNYITYSYTNDQNYPLISEISYGGNKDSGIPHFRSIRFDYERNINKRTYYHSFKESVLNSRIKTISINDSGRIVWEYRLSYIGMPSNQAELLDSIAYCIGDFCTPPTKFTYQNEKPSFELNIFTEDQLIGSEDTEKYVRFSIDVNNDGHTDILTFDKNKLYINFLKNETTSSRVETNVDLPSTWNKSRDPVFIEDINNDGFIDVLTMVTKSGGNTPEEAKGIYVLYGTGSGFKPAIQVSRELGELNVRRTIVNITDLNQDYLPEIVAFRPEGVLVLENTGEGFRRAGTDGIVSDTYSIENGWRFETDPKFVMDIDGDGSKDLVGIQRHKIIVSLGDGFSFGAPRNWVSVNDENIYNPLDDSRFFADMNRDGLVDFVGMGKFGVAVRLNQGDSFSKEEFWSERMGSESGWRNRTGFKTVVDINGDGFLDFVGIRKGQLRAIIGRGTPLAGADERELTVNFKDDFLFDWNTNFPLRGEDFNSDGVQDFSFTDPNRGIYVIQGKRNYFRLTGAVDAFKNQVKVNYDTSKLDFYNKTEEASKPNTILPNVGILVSSIEKSDGIGGFNRTSYEYEDAIIHQIDGYLGVKKWTVTDDSMNTVTENLYSTDSAAGISGLPISTKVYVNENGRLRLTSSSITSWVARKMSQNQNHLFTYNELTEKTSYDDFGQIISSTRQVSKYDDYGNLKTQEVTHAPFMSVSSCNSSCFANITTMDYFPANIARWLISQTRFVSVKRVVSGSVVNEKTTSFTYDNQGNLSTETNYPDTRYETKTTYTRQRGGHALVESQIQEWSTHLGRELPFNSIEESSTYDNYGFLKQSINALGHTTKVVERHHLTREPLVTEDANGVKSTTNLGQDLRVFSSIRAGAKESRKRHVWCDSDCPRLAVYKVITESSDGSNEIDFYDSNSRVVRKSKTLQDGMTSVLDAKFRSDGNLERESYPYFLDIEQAQWKRFSYDARKRNIKTNYPDGSEETTEYLRGNKIESSDRNGNKSVKSYDSEGKIISVQDADGELLTYNYDSVGRLEVIRDPKGNQTTIKYDDLGRQISVFEPNSGLLTYEHNLIGKYSVKDADGKTTTTKYDKLGRVIKKEYKKGSDVLTSEWVFDRSENGIGLLSKRSQQGFSESLSYDSFSRIAQKSLTIDNKSFSSTYNYDSLSRLKSHRFASGLEVGFSYDDFGFKKSTYNLSSGKDYKTITKRNASGEIIEYVNGNGTVQTNDYDERSRFIKGIKVLSGSGTSLVQRSYDFSGGGNLRSRTDAKANHFESFVYDSLNRLSRSNSSNGRSFVYDYDELGNIRNSLALSGSFEYGGSCNGISAGPHAISKVGTHEYCYNKIGQTIKSKDRSISYGLQNKPIKIQKENKAFDFTYGPDEQLVKQVYSNPGGLGSVEILYVLGAEQRILGGNTLWRHYIGDAIIEINNGILTDKYAHKDALGSTVLVSNSQQVEIEPLNYNPWGLRVDSSAQSPLIDYSPVNTDKGFTGHIMLDAVGLIHMKGRVYDPEIGRFLSPDPFVQNGENLQSYNRYSYLWNNPLSGTDPSGYISMGSAFKSAKKFLRNPGRSIMNAGKKLNKWVNVPQNQRLLASIAISATATFAGPYLVGVYNAQWISWATYAAGGYTSGYVSSSGNHDYALKSMVTALVFKGIGDKIDDSRFFLKIAAHGTAGGVSSVANGGSFESGFKSGFASAAISETMVLTGGYEHMADALGTSIDNAAFAATSAALVGGITSEATGGSFENGAITASFSALYNRFVHRVTKTADGWREEVRFWNTNDPNEPCMENGTLVYQKNHFPDGLRTDVETIAALATVVTLGTSSAAYSTYSALRAGAGKMSQRLIRSSALRFPQTAQMSREAYLRLQMLEVDVAAMYGSSFTGAVGSQLVDKVLLDFIGGQPTPYTTDPKGNVADYYGAASEVIIFGVKSMSQGPTISNGK